MKLLEAFLDFLYPEKCTFCHRILKKKEDGICFRCSRVIPYTFDNEKQKLPFIMECYSPLYYENDVKDSLHRYKFGGLQFYSKVYAGLIFENTSIKNLNYDFISYVPLSAGRLRDRGYDQAKLIAEDLAKPTGKKCIRTLDKIKNTKAQSRTGAFDARSKNISGAYRICKNTDVKGKTILLIDDIITTGSTLSEAASQLVANGAVVYAATVARARERKH